MIGRPCECQSAHPSHVRSLDSSPCRFKRSVRTCHWASLWLLTDGLESMPIGLAGGVKAHPIPVRQQQVRPGSSGRHRSPDTCCPPDASTSIAACLCRLPK